MVTSVLTYYYEYWLWAYDLDFISERYAKVIKNFISIELKT